jgi:hypothetical protein
MGSSGLERCVLDISPIKRHGGFWQGTSIEVRGFSWIFMDFHGRVNLPRSRGGYLKVAVSREGTGPTGPTGGATPRCGVQGVFGTVIGD